MKYRLILLLFELFSTVCVFSQDVLKEFVVEKTDNSARFYKDAGCTPYDGVLVFYTAIPDLEFSMPNTPSRLIRVSDYDEKSNCYVLCVKPTEKDVIGSQYIKYSIKITGRRYKPEEAFSVSDINAGIAQHFIINQKISVEKNDEKKLNFVFVGFEKSKRFPVKLYFDNKLIDKTDIDKGFQIKYTDRKPGEHKLRVVWNNKKWNGIINTSVQTDFRFEYTKNEKISIHLLVNSKDDYSNNAGKVTEVINEYKKVDGVKSTDNDVRSSISRSNIITEVSKTEVENSVLELNFVFSGFENSKRFPIKLYLNNKLIGKTYSNVFNFKSTDTKPGEHKLRVVWNNKKWSGIINTSVETNFRVDYFKKAKEPIRLLVVTKRILDNSGKSNEALKESEKVDSINSTDDNVKNRINQDNNNTTNSIKTEEEKKELELNFVFTDIDKNSKFSLKLYFDNKLIGNTNSSMGFQFKHMDTKPGQHKFRVEGPNIKWDGIINTALQTDFIFGYKKKQKVLIQELVENKDNKLQSDLNFVFIGVEKENKSSVQIYLDNRFIGDTDINKGFQFKYTDTNPGEHKLCVALANIGCSEIIKINTAVQTDFKFKCKKKKTGFGYQSYFELVK